MRVVTPDLSLVADRAARGQIRAGSGAMDLPGADARRADHGAGRTAGKAA